MAVDHGPRGCRLVRPSLLARYGLDGQLQLEQDHAKRFVSLSQPIEDGTGIAEYRLSLDPEGRAVLEAALGPLSAPRPIDGERDLRSSDQRRGEALISLVRRAVAAGDGVGAGLQGAAVRDDGLGVAGQRGPRGGAHPGRVGRGGPSSPPRPCAG